MSKHLNENIRTISANKILIKKNCFLNILELKSIVTEVKMQYKDSTADMSHGKRTRKLEDRLRSFSLNNRGGGREKN